MTASTQIWCRTETEVAAVAVEWLRSEGWEVFQEVEGPAGRCIDIVARKGTTLWALEAKKSMNLSVLDQAYDSLPFAHLVSAVVPRGKQGTTDGYRFGLVAAKALGIGVLEVWAPGAEPRIRQPVEPVRRDAVKGNLDGRLLAGQKIFAAAGSAGASHWTPFRQTSALLRQLVHKEPGVVLTEAVRKISHHYSSDENAAVELRRAIENGLIQGLRLERVNERRLKVWPSLVGGRSALTVAEKAALELRERARHTAHAKKR